MLFGNMLNLDEGILIPQSERSSASKPLSHTNYSEAEGADLEDLIVPEDFAPILDELPLYTETTSLGIALYWAPR